MLLGCKTTTNKHFPDTLLTSPSHILITQSTRRANDNCQFYKSSFLLDWEQKLPISSTRSFRSTDSFIVHVYCGVAWGISAYLHCWWVIGKCVWGVGEVEEGAGSRCSSSTTPSLFNQEAYHIWRWVRKLDVACLWRFVYLLLIDIQATSKVISEWVPTCDKTQVSTFYSAVQHVGYQAR